MNQTDRHNSVWMVVRFDGSERRMPIWLNSLMIRVAVFRLQPHIKESSTLEAMNCPGCRTAEKWVLVTVVLSMTARRMKVLKHFIRLMSRHSSDR